MSSTLKRTDHPVARALSWVFGAVAGAATIWLVFLGLSVMSEWDGYVGHESSTALAILGYVGVAPAVLAWLLFAIAYVVARRGRDGRSG